MGGGKGYGGKNRAPWRFQGRALYQLCLIKSSDARKHVPDDLKLVEAFGYTLGGVYLARYDDSPAGTFDELVALGGLVWNPPTSCAWAAKVFRERPHRARARREDVRAPVRVRVVRGRRRRRRRRRRGGRDGGAGAGAGDARGWWKNDRPTKKRWGRVPFLARREKRVAERVKLVDDAGGELCSLALPAAAPKLAGPRINMFLPSFSGRTPSCPDLLKYSLCLRANVRLSDWIRVGDVVAVEDDDAASDAEVSEKREEKAGTGEGGPGGFWAPSGERRFPPQLALASVSLSDVPATAAAATTIEEDEKGAASKSKSKTAAPGKSVAGGRDARGDIRRKAVVVHRVRRHDDGRRSPGESVVARRASIITHSSNKLRKL